MKHFTPFVVIIALLMISLANHASADTPSYVIPMESSEEPDYVYSPPTRHRMPSKRIDCIITPEGIESSSFNTNDITTFEVYDSNGEQLGIFIEEQNFILFLYSLTGQLEIRLHFDGYVLHGYMGI